MSRSYAECVKIIMSQLQDGSIRESQFPKSLQPIVASLIKRGKLYARRMDDGDYLVSKE